MDSETFFARLFSDREYTPAHFRDHFWSARNQCFGAEMPWLERLDQYMGIYDADLVLEAPHRAHHWPAIHALRDAGFGVHLRSYRSGFWAAYGARGDGATRWEAGIRYLDLASARFDAEIRFITSEPQNHRIEWGALGETPEAALSSALKRAREGFALLMTTGAP